MYIHDLVRTFTFPLGRIEIIRRPQDLSDLDVLEFDHDYLMLYVDQVADGVLVPVELEARVVFHNGVILKSFTADVDVENADAIVSCDYQEVVSEALDWVREQFVPQPIANVQAQPPLLRQVA